LIYATPAGVEAAAVLAAPVPKEPAPTTWAHLEACAWTAAWFTARGRHVIGERELLLESLWRGELEWLERDGLRRRGHHPDMLAGLTPDGPLLPVEVELASKSVKRLRSILALHASWIAAGKTSAVIYVCGPPRLADRVRREGAQYGLDVDRKTLRVELLETIRETARSIPRPQTAHVDETG
jgi:hypothetical protein